MEMTTMPLHPIIHSNVPIRLFTSDLLERCTHTHPVVIVLLWLPVAVYFAGCALGRPPAGSSAACLVLGFVLGVVLWTGTEYTLHRFVFHYAPRHPAPRITRLLFLLHGVHHAQPQLKTRLVIPPVVSVPLAVWFYALFSLGLGTLLQAPQWINPVFSGFTTGYLVYDLTHYATHHRAMRWGVLKALKRHHLLHHFQTPTQRFGVSSPFWDAVSGTLPVAPRPGSVEGRDVGRRGQDIPLHCTKDNCSPETHEAPSCDHG
jgi:sterol desaturase/sphingolipid hydroxylase (fatty acid hydroxylase superfamily)